MERKILLQDLADILAEKRGVTKKKADAFVRCFFETAGMALVNEKFVKIKGFGTFKLVSVGERESVNISTGERFQINGHSKISFTPDAMIRDLVNRPFAHFHTVILNEDTSVEELELVPEIEEPENVQIEEETTDEKPDGDNVVEAESSEQLQNEAEYDTASQSVVTEEEQQQTATSEIAEGEEPLVADDTDLTPDGNEKSSSVDEAAHLQEQQPDESDQDKAVLTSEEQDGEDSVQLCVPLSDDGTPGNMGSAPDRGMDSSQQIINWWKVAFLVLCTLLLMILSYFAGYFRVFCPCEQAYHAAPHAMVSTKQPVEGQKVTPLVQEPQKELEKKPEAVKKDSLKQTKNNTVVSDAKASAASDMKANEKKYSQLKGGRYAIVGVIESHTLKAGESVYGLARKYYGDKAMAPYIIHHNNLKNPDHIEVGRVLRIPRLVKRE